MAAKKKSAKRSVGTNGERVWALLVVSSEVQSDTLPHQRAWAEETSSVRGWRLTRIVEGVSSGVAGPRKLVRGVISDLAALEPEARPKRLLMIRSDRLGRGSIVESQIVLSDLRRLGVSVWTREEGEVKLETAMDEMISAMRLGVASLENEVRRDKMLGVYQRKRAAGVRIGNKLPYGLIDKGGKDVSDGKRGAAVKTAFQMRSAGHGYHTIGLKLKAIAPPQRFKTGREVIVRWTPTRISRLLSNRAYIGPIVDAATFSRTQLVSASLSSPERKPKRFPWPLSGSLRCYCGRAMTGMACGDADRRIRYYACRASWNHDVSNRLVRADSLEAQFVALLRRLRASPDLVERYRKKAAPSSPRLLERSLAEATRQLADIDRKRDSAWELHVAGKVRSDDVQERLDALSGQREEVRARIATTQEQLAVSRSAAVRDRDADSLIRRAAELFTRAKELEQRQIARAVALALGGLCVEEDGKLAVRPSLDPQAQRRPHS